MDMERLQSIGTFARAVGLAPSALRYYDEAGLLSPAQVDTRTGYRYYSPDLERRALLIRRLREANVSVKTMRVVLDGTSEQAAATLREIADRANDSAQRTAAAMADVWSILVSAARAVGPVEVTLAGPELAAALQQVARAAATDEGSPLAGVLVEVGSTEVSVVATNRYWLAVWSIALPQVHLSRARVVIPLSAVGALTRWLVVRRTVSLSLTAEAVRLSSGDDERLVRPLEDRFPTWRLVQGQPAPIGRAVLAGERLLHVLDGSTVGFAVGHDRVTVNPDQGPEGVHLPAATSGKRIRLGFSVGLLTAVVQTMVGPQVSFDYAPPPPDQPVQISSPSQPQLSALLMPA